MSNLAALTTQRDGLLKKIRAIEAACEGIENENNAKRVQELNLEQTQYSAQRQEIAAKLAVLDGNLANINAEILELSGTGVEKILAAIKNQRWYFFKNKPKVFMDRDTGILWTNLEYFSYRKSDGDRYSETEAKEIVSKVGTIDGYGNWKRPTYEQIIFMCESKTMPFHEGYGSGIKGEVCWFANKMVTIWLIQKLKNTSTLSRRHT